MTNLEYCNEILSIIGNVTEANDAIYNLAFDAYQKLGGQESQPSLATIYNELKNAIQIWDNTDSLNITENGTYNLLGKIITVNVQGGQPGPIDDKFRIEAIESSTITFKTSPASRAAQYSSNASNWIDATEGDVISLQPNEKLYIRAQHNKNYDNMNLIVTGKASAKGNCGYLINYNNYQPSKLYSYGLGYLFKDSTGLYDASELELPYWIYSGENYCYLMFAECTNLIGVPTIPKENVQNVANNVFGSMFRNCERLNKIVSYSTYVISRWDKTQSWLQGVSATGDFYNYGKATSISELPAGWTIHTN